MCCLCQCGEPLNSEGRETGTTSTRFKLRRLEDVIVVESVSEGLNHSEALSALWGEALGKKQNGIIIHLPSPKYVSSLFIRGLYDCALDASEKNVPFVLVVHPKLRLLFHMFELLDEVPIAERLDRAMDAIKVQQQRAAKPKS